MLYKPETVLMRISHDIHDYCFNTEELSMFFLLEITSTKKKSCYKNLKWLS